MLPLGPVGRQMLLDAASPAFRRGRALTALLVVVTAAMIVWNAVGDQRTGYTVDARYILGNGLVAWVVAVCVFRGGKLSTGCLMVFYVAALLPMMLVIYAALAVSVWSVDPGSLFKINGEEAQAYLHDLGSMALLLGYTAWAGFACWVLFLSKDARLYRSIRRWQDAEERVTAFAWPPRKRRAVEAGDPTAGTGLEG